MDWGAFAGAGVGSCAVVLVGGIVSNLAFKRYWKKKSLLQERDVEIGPASDEGEKEEVRQKLRDAIESRDPENLRNGIEKAEALDMKEQVVTDARRVLKEEKDAVKKMLKDAVAARDPQGLRTGIAKGEALGMKDSELAEARRVLEEEKAATKQELQQAMEARDIDRLRAAIERGEALGLKPGDLVEPKKVLKELEKAEKEKKKKVKRDRRRGPSEGRGDGQRADGSDGGGSRPTIGFASRGVTTGINHPIAAILWLQSPINCISDALG